MKNLRTLGLVAVGIGLLLAGWWAGRVALESPQDPLTQGSPADYQVVTGEVGRSLTFASVAEWQLVPIGVGAAQGVITSIEAESGQTISSGDLLLTVDLRPVVVAQGEVPSFRSLSLRTQGPDVAQLQQMLTDLGFYSGEIDGDFGSGVATAVRAWHKALGIDNDSEVRPGDIVFLPSLPARIALDENLRVGSRLGGGEGLVWLVPDAPEFYIPLTVDQRSLVPLSADVFVTFVDGTWPARITAAQEGDFDQLNLLLEAPDGGPVCGTSCVEFVALSGRTDFRTEIVVDPKVEGPVVPAAALGTASDGQPFVTLPDGTRVPVTILGASNGLAVVQGIEAGTVILLPFEE